MRFERHGGPPDLQAAFTELVLRKLNGRALDDNRSQEAAQGEFPDFGCFRDIMLIEMKHLESDQHERINEILEEKIDPAERPLFYGARESRFILDVISNADEVNAAVYVKLGRTIEGLLRKANHQFGSYRSRHPRKNAVNLCVILNSKLREYTPDMIARSIHGKMKTSQAGAPRFSNIDAVLYISEKHFRQLPDGRPALAMAVYEASGAIDNPWKVKFIDRVANAWSHSRTGKPIVRSEQLSDFDTIRDIPDSMSRAELWLLEYERNPYLAGFTDERLRVLFHRTMAVNSLTFLKGAWAKPSEEEIVEALRIFQHIVAETNRRGLDMRRFDRSLLTAVEEAEIFEDLPSELVAILSERKGA